MDPLEIIHQFDQFLFDKDVRYTSVVVGPSALVLMKTIQRQTEGIEVLSPPITPDIQKLADEFREEQQKKGINLPTGWLKNTPDTLLKALPPDWVNRVRAIYPGRAIRVMTLGRRELLKLELWDYCSRREETREDLLKMEPTTEELTKCLSWVQQRDTTPDWPAFVAAQFQKITSPQSDK